MPTPPLVEIKDLVFEYPKTRALDHVSFTLNEGSITALVGPNGAGKSTLMRCMAALTKPLSGDIYLDGIDVVENPRETHRLLGYLSDFFGLYNDLKVTQSLYHSAGLRGLFDQDAEKAVSYVIEKLDLTELLGRKLDELSRGQRQRVGIAQAIIHKPKIVLLDEPASGLDPEARHQLSKLLIALNAEGISFLVSSHILTELEEYSQELLVIGEGKILEHKTLKSNTLDFSKTIKVELKDNALFALELLKGIQGVMDAYIDDNLVLFKIPKDSGVENTILNTLISNGLSIIQFQEYKINLQDEYIKTINQNKS